MAGPLPRHMPLTMAIVVPCRDQVGDLGLLLSRLRQVIDRFALPAALFVVDEGSTAAVAAVAATHGARRIVQQRKGYGGALQISFAEIDAQYLVTIECDAGHPPHLVRYLYEARLQADVIIASRYVRQGYARMPVLRSIASRLLNATFRGALDLPVRDLSSGYRLYRREAIHRLAIESTSYAVLQEILIKAYCEGFTIIEIPMHYLPGASAKGWGARA